MVDTVRTIEDILALYADNTTGDISPQDARDMIVSLAALSPAIPLTATITTQGAGTGTFNMIGFYDCPAADSNLTEISVTQTVGAANSSHAAHIIAVAAGGAATDGADLVLTVSGTSITDAGVRTTSDSEVLVADCVGAATDTYFETSKKWLGQVTYTLTSSGGASFSFDFNYGFASYQDNDNTDFTLEHFSFEWYSGANDSGFDINVCRHEAAGWTYHASAFVPGTTPLYIMTTDHSTDRQLVSGTYGKWKRTGLSNAFNGAGSEGLVVNIVTTVNNSIEWINANIHINLDV